ncbi:MAG: hypothetical protein AAGI01_16175, partial [Myxococcota bacterium]
EEAERKREAFAVARAQDARAFSTQKASMVADRTANARSRRASFALHRTTKDSETTPPDDVLPVADLSDMGSAEMGAAAELQQPEHEPTYVWKISARPHNAELFIDGKLVPYDGFFFQPTLTRGNHPYTLKKEGFREKRGTIHVSGEQRITERLALDYEPARVTVSANHTARVKIEDETTWKTLTPGDPAMLDIEMGTCCDVDGEREVTVIIRRNPFLAGVKGHEQVRTVRIKPNRTTALSFSFPGGR